MHLFYSTKLEEKLVPNLVSRKKAVQRIGLPSIIDYLNLYRSSGGLFDASSVIEAF